MFQEYMDKLVEAVTTKEFSEEVIKAKKEYFSKVGPPAGAFFVRLFFDLRRAAS